MNKKYQDITFYIDTNVSKQELDVNNKIKVEYKNEEFTTKNIGDFSIYLNDSYLNFEVDIESKKIVGFSGIYPLKKYDKVNIVLPSSFSKGILKVKENKKFMKGTGTRMNFDCNPCYDEKTQILIFGKFNNNQSYCQFLENGYIQLDEKDCLTSLIITDISIHK